jgi:hypothetical protein
VRCVPSNDGAETESDTSIKKTVYTRSAFSVRATRASASAITVTSASLSASERSCCCHGRSASDRGKMRRKNGAIKSSPSSRGDRSTYVICPRVHESVASGEFQT